MPQFSGGFGGDRAGIMGLTSQLDNLANMGMRNRAQDQQENYVKSVMEFRNQALANQISNEKRQQGNAMRNLAGALKVQGVTHPIIKQLTGYDFDRPTAAPDLPPTGEGWKDPRSMTDLIKGLGPNSGSQLFADLGAGGLAFGLMPGGIAAKSVAAGVAGTAMNTAINKGRDLFNPDEVLQREVSANYKPSIATPTPTPIMGAKSKAMSGVKSVDSPNVLKRKNRGMGLSNLSIPDSYDMMNPPSPGK